MPIEYIALVEQGDNTSQGGYYDPYQSYDTGAGYPDHYYQHNQNFGYGNNQPIFDDNALYGEFMATPEYGGGPYIWDQGDVWGMGDDGADEIGLGGGVGGMGYMSDRSDGSHRDLLDVVASGVPRPMWPQPRKFIYDSMRYIGVALDLVWWIVLILVWVGKYFVDNPDNYGHFLTNWSWTCQAIYFTLKLLATATGSRRLLWFTYYFVFWPVWINVWEVMFMVVAVLVDSPGLLTDLFKSLGAGEVLAGDRLFHVFTFVFIILDFFCTIKDHFGFLDLRPSGLWLFILMQVVFAHIITLSYLALNDIYSVYDLHDLHWWGLILIYEPIMLLSGVLFMYGCSKFRDQGGLDYSED